jgi:hypothetical protein
MQFTPIHVGDRSTMDDALWTQSQEKASHRLTISKIRLANPYTRNAEQVTMADACHVAPEVACQGSQASSQQPTGASDDDHFHPPDTRISLRAELSA